MTTMPPPPPGNWGDDPNRRDEYPSNPPFNGPPSPGHGAPGYGYPHGGDRINTPNYGQNYQQRDPGPYGQPPKKGKGLLIGLIAGAVALVVLLVVVVILATRGDDNDPTPAPPANSTAPVTAAPPVTTNPATPPAEPTATTPVEPTTPAGGTIEGSPRPGASDAKFLAALMITDNKGTNHGTYWGNVPAQESLGLGYAICGAYDRNVEPTEIVKTIVDAGIPQNEANWVRAAAVVMLCPEHKST